jgi:hypothetical protein
MSTRSLSSESFNLICSCIISDREFGKIFFEKPEAALKRNGISLSQAELSRIRSFSPVRHDNVKSGFDEGSVLCSAPP